MGDPCWDDDDDGNVDFLLHISVSWSPEHPPCSSHCHPSTFVCPFWEEIFLSGSFSSICPSSISSLLRNPVYTILRWISGLLAWPNWSVLLVLVGRPSENHLRLVEAGFSVVFILFRVVWCMSVRPLLECDNTYTRDRNSYTCQKNRKNHTFTLLGNSYCRDHALTIIEVKESRVQHVK